MVTATFILIGIQLFGGQMNFDGEDLPRYHFDNIYWAFITLFVVTTGEQWPGIFFNGMRSHFWAGLIYFVAWKSISTCNFIFFLYFFCFIYGFCCRSFVKFIFFYFN